jgi:hypothetical protein
MGRAGDGCALAGIGYGARSPMGLIDRLRKENSVAARTERRAQVERVLTQSLRSMGTLMTKLADLIERQRLQRGGYAQQERFLERNKPKEP